MSNYELKFSTQFKKDFKKIAKDKSKLQEVEVVFQFLMDDGFKAIPTNMRPHLLKGFLKNSWECHIRPDLLIIWFQIEEPTNTINLVRIGSHSEILKM